ncbi:hypothetical protein ACELLULO517_09230 [Acidisoma cellulosilytica]|uniref:Uncharacterized protein n=1 Tax=Acidisoma cellulosilyticum TaxID=2802395 RepID=A0A964E3Y2_9PROT|nr:hypothetical protein [Acidisoma cellulosilyticum]MCB8880413.1 hypothetical protein [Acidisoma cellulosilyticum]
MRALRRLLQRDWDEIGQALLQIAARQLAEAARSRADAPHSAITVAQTAPDRLRLFITTADLIRREQGDSGKPPAPFLAPTAHDRANLRAALIDHIRKTIA